MGWALALGKLPSTSTDEFVWALFCLFSRGSELMNALVLLLQREERKEKDAEMGRPGEVMNHVMKYIN